jgi:hypothetical protein
MFGSPLGPYQLNLSDSFRSVRGTAAGPGSDHDGPLRVHRTIPGGAARLPAETQRWVI